MSELLKWLRENNVVAFFILLLFIAAIVATVYIMKAIARFKKVEKECDKISNLQDTAQINGTISNRIEKNIDEKLLPKIDSIVTSINGLVLFLNTKHKDFKSEVFVVKSPVELSPIGMKILEDFGGKSYIDLYTEKLIKIMEQVPLKSALDVQNQATSVIFTQVDSDEFVAIKNYIFNNPIYRVDGKDIANLDISTIAQIMGIYLRNKYFEKHPELRDAEDSKK